MTPLVNWPYYCSRSLFDLACEMRDMHWTPRQMAAAIVDELVNDRHLPGYKRSWFVAAAAADLAAVNVDE